MKLSNDIKYNKIKEIEEELYHLLFHFNYEDNNWNDETYGEMKQRTKRETWILANKIYDISVEGLKDEYDDEKYYCNKPKHWKDLIDEINEDYTIARLYYFQNDWLEGRWNFYNYVNS